MYITCLYMYTNMSYEFAYGSYYISLPYCQVSKIEKKTPTSFKVIQMQEKSCMLFPSAKMVVQTSCPIPSPL